MAQRKGKPSKNRKPSTSKHRSEKELLQSKFVGKITPNQKLWNDQIDRLIRFENNYTGLKVHLPKKPKKVTKKDLSEIKGIKGVDVLDISTVNVPAKDEIRNLQRGEMNAREYYEKIAGNRPLSAGGAKILKTNLKYEKQRVTEEDTETKRPTDPVSEKQVEDKTPPFSPLTKTEITIMEFERSVSKYRPEFQKLMNDWQSEMMKAMTPEEFAEALAEYTAQNGSIDRAQAYNMKNLIEWERKFVENLPQGSEARQKGEDYLTELEQDADVRDEYEEVQQVQYESRKSHRKPLLDWEERRKQIRERGYQ